MAKVIANMGSLMRKLDSLGGNVQNALAKAMKTTLESAQGSAEKNTEYGSVRSSLKVEMKVTPDSVDGKVFTNLFHAKFIEFGTGPKGQANHGGISPHVPVTYTLHPWAYHSEDYGWVTTSGQPARPFLYPAAKENEETFKNETREKLLNEIRRMGG